MEYSDDYLRAHLSREIPPVALVPGDVIREIERRSERGRFDDAVLLARSVMWTYAILSEIGLGNFRSRGGSASMVTAAPAVIPAALPVMHFPAAGLPVSVEGRTSAKSRTVARDQHPGNLSLRPGIPARGNTAWDDHR